MITDAPHLLGLSLLLVVCKLVIVAALARWFGRPWQTGPRVGLLLGPGGEFRFVILRLARATHLMDRSVADFLLTVVALTMACIPLLSVLGDWIFRRSASAGFDDAGPLAAMRGKAGS